MGKNIEAEIQGKKVNVDLDDFEGVKDPKMDVDPNAGLKKHIEKLGEADSDKGK